jgi:hypothetical protein
VVVDIERGQDLGRVRTVGGVAAKKCGGCGTDGAGGRRSGASSAALPPRRCNGAMALRADEERVRRQARTLVEQHT